jgi:hypothetical protein
MIHVIDLNPEKAYKNISTLKAWLYAGWRGRFPKQRYIPVQVPNPNLSLKLTCDGSCFLLFHLFCWGLLGEREIRGSMAQRMKIKDDRCQGFNVHLHKFLF